MIALLRTYPPVMAMLGGMVLASLALPLIQDLCAASHREGVHVFCLHDTEGQHPTNAGQKPCHQADETAPSPQAETAPVAACCWLQGTPARYAATVPGLTQLPVAALSQLLAHVLPGISDPGAQTARATYVPPPDAGTTVPARLLFSVFLI